MNAKNLLTERAKSPYKLDINSDRFRRCPNDGVEFMASHRTRIFCSDRCADEYHNLKKKSEQEATLLHDVDNALLSPIPKKSEYLSSQDVILTFEDKIKNNLRVLDSLEIEDEDGSYFNIDQLTEIGYEIDVFDGKGELFNTGVQKCYFLQIKNYRIYRVEYSKVLIKKII